MKVMIKMTRGGHSEIDAEPMDTIRVVKAKIKESPAPLGFAVDSQKIICEGKVLKDDGTLESYGFSENIKDKYLVLMVKQNNLATTVPSNALSMTTPFTNTATISSVEPGLSNSGILTPSSFQQSSQSSTVNQFQSASQTAQIVGDTATIPSVEPGLSNSGIPTPSSIQPSSQSSTVNQFQTTSQAQIVGDTATISSVEPGPSNSGTLTPSSSIQPSSQSSTVNQFKRTSQTAQIVGDTATISNSGILTPSSSTQPSSQLSTVSQLQSASRTAQIVGVGSDGDQKVLATLQGSEIDEFEQLRAMGFSQQATVEAYLCCGKNVEHAALYLSENGNAVADESNARPDAQTTRRAEMYGVDSNGDKKLLATLEGSEVDDIEVLQALGFSQQAAVEVYLLCDREKERAASFLIENGKDSSSSDPKSTNNVAELIGSLDGSDIEQIEQLKTLGFPHAVALAAYLACNKNAQLAASALIEHGAELNLGSDNGSTISNTPLALSSTSDPKASPSPVFETSGSSPTPSQKSLGKRPEFPLSPHSDDDRVSKKIRTSENSPATSLISSSIPSSPPTSFLDEVSPKSQLMIIDDSEVEDKFTSEEKFTIDKLEKMGFPHEAVIEAICVCKGDEGCIEYLCEKGYEV